MAAECSELEVASSISEFKELSGGSATWQECTEAAIAGNTPCAAYAHQLAKICELYGGGAGSPIIKKLDAFAKRFTANVKLGEEFVSAIADTVISPSLMCVRTRAALVAANLTSPKVVDGVAKLHARCDVSGLKGKMDEVEELEQ